MRSSLALHVALLALCACGGSAEPAPVEAVPAPGPQAAADQPPAAAAAEAQLGQPGGRCAPGCGRGIHPQARGRRPRVHPQDPGAGGRLRAAGRRAEEGGGRRRPPLHEARGRRVEGARSRHRHRLLRLLAGRARRCASPRDRQSRRQPVMREVENMRRSRRRATSTPRRLHTTGTPDPQRRRASHRISTPKASVHRGAREEVARPAGEQPKPHWCGCRRWRPADHEVEGAAHQSRSDAGEPGCGAGQRARGMMSSLARRRSSLSSSPIVARRRRRIYAAPVPPHAGAHRCPLPRLLPAWDDAQLGHSRPTRRARRRCHRSSRRPLPGARRTGAARQSRSPGVGRPEAVDPVAGTTTERSRRPGRSIRRDPSSTVCAPPARAGRGG